ncbi:hypothetical protein [Streptomyces aidingensis]|uniref:Uncharacterized protein n=1 Tax=Streptomyces aidingensis TaxID=910347 RepID=A0A1I1VFH3_9ACTN|nr:hypothetical protein [Streptomyces aidingensis]SFD81535.1 hypothetical protein SAMN05421773_1358 [Streptomyces aidingensis]
MSNSDLSMMTENQLNSRAMQGDTAAVHALFDRQQTREHEERMAAAGSRRPGSSGGLDMQLLWNLFLLALPVLALVAVIRGLAQGTEWLAEQSVLSPLFPAPGDSPARYLLSVLTLLLIIPGSLTLLAARLGSTRLRVPARLVLIPAAALLVPVILFITQSTTTADLVRLPG